MRRLSLILALVLTAPALSGCIVPEDMTALREDLGYASVERPDLVVKARASTLTPTVTETVDLTAETTGLPVEDVDVTWTLDNETREGAQINASFAQAGVHEVEVEAVGPNGTTAQDALELEVKPNEPPELTLVVEGADSLRADEPVTIRADTADPDGDDLSFDWRLDGEQIDAGPRLSRSLEAGPHEVEVTVSDGHVTRSASQAFAVDLPISHEAQLSATSSSAQFTLPVEPGADQLDVVLTHTTNAGVEDVNLTLQGPEGEVVARSDQEPGPGASQGVEELTVGEDLATEPHTLLAQHVRGSDTTVTIEGVLTYSPLPGDPS